MSDVDIDDSPEDGPLGGNLSSPLVTPPNLAPLADTDLSYPTQGNIDEFLRLSGAGIASLVVLAPSQKVEIHTALAIFDADETNFKGTGHHVHDGRGGRFALALSSILDEDHDILFDFENWPEYRKLAGVAEAHVCQRMADQANRQYDVKIDPLDLQRRANQLLQTHFADFMQHVELNDGIRTLIEQGHEAGCLQAVCSSSSEEFVMQALKHFELDPHYHLVVGSAPKKHSGEVFNGNPITEICEELDVRPESSTMFGDSMADFGAAALAEVPLIIIRLPHTNRTPDDNYREIQRFSASIEEAANHDHNNFPNDDIPTVIFVEEFSQVRLSCSKGDKTRFTILTDFDSETT